MRMLPCLLLLLATATATPAVAAPGGSDYHPIRFVIGLPYKFGYMQAARSDGTWRVSAVARRGQGLDMAMYRAAEIAREQGFAYVEFLGGSGVNVYGTDTVTLKIRLSDRADAPANCPTKRKNVCYTASVAEVLRRLGGEGGMQPGVPVVDHLDKYGRSVSYSGYGIGMVQPAARVPLPAPLPRVAPLVAAPVAAPVAPSATAPRIVASNTARPDPVTEYQRALKAAQPIHGRDAQQGWTISD